MAGQHDLAAAQLLRKFLREHHLNLSRSRHEQEHQLAEGAYQLVQPIQTDAPAPDRQPALVSTSQNAPQNVLYYQGNLPTDLKLEDIQSVDIEFMESQLLDVPSGDLARSEGLVFTEQFEKWITSPESKELFILGNLHNKSLSSGLSMLCSLLVNEATGIPGWMPMVFFCGRYRNARWLRRFGARGMLRSFIAQMLMSKQRFTPEKLEMTIAENAIEGDIHALFDVFRLVVYQMPEAMTLICIIDGINFLYDHQLYEKDMEVVLPMLLDLLKDPNMEGKLKLLVTSPEDTGIKGQFQWSILSMHPEPIL